MNGVFRQSILVSAFGLLAAFGALLSGCQKNYDFYTDPIVESEISTLCYGNDCELESRLEVTKAELVFGRTSVDFRSLAVIEIQNTGKKEVKALRYFTSDRQFDMAGGAFPGIGGNCPAVIKGGQKCLIGVSFTPKEVKEAKGSLLVDYRIKDSVGILDIPIRGTGIAAATLAFEAGESFQFPKARVNTPLQRTIRVLHFGINDAILTRVDPLASGFQFAGGSYPGTGGTCGTTKIGKGGCTLEVIFQPSGLGNFDRLFEIVYNFEEATKPARTRLLGEGVFDAPAELVFFPESGDLNITQDGKVLGGQSAVRFFEIENRGTRAATLQAHTFAPAGFIGYSGTGYPGLGSSCPANGIIPGGMRCALQFIFLAPISGDFLPMVSDLSIRYEAGEGSIKFLNRRLSGTRGERPNIGLTQLDAFEDVPVRKPGASSASFRISILNPATAVNLMNVRLNQTGSSAFGAAGGSFAGNYRPTDTGQATIAFNPTDAHSGIQTGQIVVLSDNGINSPSLNFTARALDDAELVVGSPAFASMIAPAGSASTGTATVTRYGRNGARFDSLTTPPAPFRYAGNAYPGTGGTCPALGSIMTATTCTVVYQFQPENSGNYNSPIALNYTDTGLGVPKSALYSLVAQGQRVALLLANPSPLNFPNLQLGSEVILSLTIRNGDSNLYYQASSLVLQLGGTHSGDFSLVSSGSTCAGAVIPGGLSCTQRIRFRPLASGSRTATLDVNYTDGVVNSRNFSVTLNGSAFTTPHLAFSPNPLDFGKIAIGTQKDLTLTVTNDGNAPAQNVTVNTNNLLSSGPTSFKNQLYTILQDTCSGATLAATSGQCQLSIRFHPAFPGRFTGSIAFTVSAAAGGYTGDTVSVVANGRVPVGVAAGFDHTCIKTDRGAARCMGNNQAGQLGTGSMGTDANIGIPFGLWIDELAAGGNHTCAKLNDGRVKCWGKGDDGQLGYGSAVNRMSIPENEFVDLGAGVTAISLKAGDKHTCALVTGGMIKCWGSNSNGRLGLLNSSLDKVLAPTPVQVSLGGTATAIAVGSAHTCALVTTGAGAQVKCWGANLFGQLGTGDNMERGGSGSADLVAVNLGPGFTPAQVSLGGGFSCVVSTAGQIKCFGKNFDPELGVAGQLGTCFAQFPNGSWGRCWDPGVLGNSAHYGVSPNDYGANLPVVNLGSGFAASKMASSLGLFNCVIGGSGGSTIKCFGENTWGQLGQGMNSAPAFKNFGDQNGEMGDALPGYTSGSPKPTSLALGMSHACALFEDQSVKCWGRAAGGQIGSATEGQTLSSTPFQNFD